jgi:hypothetical protein
MNWTTLYIAGNDDFREEVIRKLENSKIDFMPGYLEGSNGRGVCELYWVNEKHSVREFKEAIGGKLVWKYRLRVFTSLEDALAISGSNDVNFTPEEQLMLDAMRKSA